MPANLWPLHKTRAWLAQCLWHIMSDIDFLDLASQFCNLVGSSVPVLTPDADGMLTFSTRLRDVDLSISHDPVHLPDQVHVLAFFGPVADAIETVVLRQLLHANLALTGASRCAFGRNPISGDIVLVSTCPLAELSAENLLAGLQAIADAALQWRSDPTQGQFDGEPFSTQVRTDVSFDYRGAAHER